MEDFFFVFIILQVTYFFNVSEKITKRFGDKKNHFYLPYSFIFDLLLTPFQPSKFYL